MTYVSLWRPRAGTCPFFLRCAVVAVFLFFFVSPTTMYTPGPGVKQESGQLQRTIELTGMGLIVASYIGYPC